MRVVAAFTGAHTEFTGNDRSRYTLTEVAGAIVVLDGKGRREIGGKFEYIVQGGRLTHQRFVAGSGVVRRVGR